MSIAYKRLLNELSMFNKNYNYNNFKNVNYDLHIINSISVMFINKIDFRYNNIIYNVKIYYNKSYPFQCPVKLDLNNNNLFDLYKKIINKNKEIMDVNSCICCESLLCSNNWNATKNIKDILKEIEKVINYKKLYVNRLLLNKIIKKFTNQNMEYLEKYLL